MVSKARSLLALGTRDFLTCKYFELLLTRRLEKAFITAARDPKGMEYCHDDNLQIGVGAWGERLEGF